MNDEYQKEKTWRKIISNKNYDLAYTYWEALEGHHYIDQDSNYESKDSGKYSEMRFEIDINAFFNIQNNMV
jgi:hypothetical protein